jgi:hypothetical protein
MIYLPADHYLVSVPHKFQASISRNKKAKTSHAKLAKKAEKNFNLKLAVSLFATSV